MIVVWCLVCCRYDVWYVVWYVICVVWYNTLLGVLLNMLLYAWLGMLIDSTLLWDMLLMRRFSVVGVNWVVMSLRVIVLVQVVFR